MKTVVLVDMDNVTGNKNFETLLSFYTKETVFVIFGLGCRYGKLKNHNLNANHKKISRLNDCFRFLPEQIDFDLLNIQVPDGADMKMFEYVGAHLHEWTDVENVLVVSGDASVYNLAILLKQKYNTWIVMDHTHAAQSKCYANSKKIGIHVPRIILK